MAFREFSLWPFLKEVWQEASANHLFDVAAQLAFWALLALFPFAILVLTILGYLPLQGIADEATLSFYRVMPGQAADLIDQTLREVVGRQRGWLVAASLAGALWSAAGGVSSAISALDRAYAVPDRGSYLRTKSMSVAVTVLLAVLSIIACLAVFVGPGVVNWISGHLGLREVFAILWPFARWGVALGAMLLLLACVYYFLPNVKNSRFRFITPGALVAVIGWVVVSVSFRLYVTHFSTYAKTYGTLGGAVVLLLWLYLTSVMILLGGQINAILDRRILARQHEAKDAREMPGWIKSPVPQRPQPQGTPQPTP